MVIEKGRKIDVSDLRANKLVMFQHRLVSYIFSPFFLSLLQPTLHFWPFVIYVFSFRYYIPIYLVVGLLIPILIPVYGWNESLWNSFFVAYCLRYVMVLNLTWCVNSVAHTFGTKPYDKWVIDKKKKNQIDINPWPRRNYWGGMDKFARENIEYKKSIFFFKCRWVLRVIRGGTLPGAIFRFRIFSNYFSQKLKKIKITVWKSDNLTMYGNLCLNLY